MAWMRSKKVWWVVGGVVLVLLAAVILLLTVGKDQPKLYWNVQQERQPDENGYYHLQFFENGQLQTYRTKDQRLVETVDQYRALQLTVDKEGILQSVMDTEYAVLADRDLVQIIEGQQLTLNSSIAFNGKQQSYQLAKNCQVVDVSGETPIAAQLKVMDEVLVYGTEREITHIYILKRTQEAKLYWRVERKYSSGEKATSRKPDEDGIYTILFAADGQQIELKCRDKDLVTQIDIPGSSEAAMGISVDADGFITGVQDVYLTIRGKTVCSLYDVVSVEGNTLTAVNKQSGNTYGKTIVETLAPDCKFYDVSNGAELVGMSVDSLQPYDRITAYGDAMGNICYVFIHVRLVDSPVYFNITRMYKDSDTTREPDADGWYVFDMACEGSSLKVKTQDRAIAKKMDSYSHRGMGLKLDGDVVQRVYSIDCVTGNSALVTGRYVGSIAGAMVTTYSGNSRLTPLMLNMNYKVYDVTGNPGTEPGQETTLQENDRINAFGNTDDEAVCIYVTKRVIPET